MSMTDRICSQLVFQCTEEHGIDGLFGEKQMGCLKQWQRRCHVYMERSWTATGNEHNGSAVSVMSAMCPSMLQAS